MNPMPPNQEPKPMSEEWNDYMNALVRDMTAAGSIPKSEARRRILELISLANREAQDALRTREEDI